MCCDKHAVNYIVGLAKNTVLKRLAAPHLQQAEKQFELTEQKQRIFAEVEYGAATWDKRPNTLTEDSLGVILSLKPGCKIT